MLTIKCAKCNRKLLKYQKIGKGRVLRCWKERIKENYSPPAKGEIRCECGNVIGTDFGPGYKMKQKAFTYTGTKI